MDVPAARLTLVRLLVVVSALGPVSHPQVMAAGGRVLRHLTVYEARAEYCGWPSMARTANGDLVVLFCRSEEHLGPDGAILLCRSSDNGKTWARPKVIVDTPLDDRESGCTVLDDGRMLAHVLQHGTRQGRGSMSRPITVTAGVARRLELTQSMEVFNSAVDHSFVPHTAILETVSASTDAIACALRGNWWPLSGLPGLTVLPLVNHICSSSAPAA